MKPVVFITGASSGIGESLARHYMREGAGLALCARRTNRLEALVEEARALDVEAVAIPCDVTSQEEVDRAVAVALRRYGRIDTVYANAGVAISGPFASLTQQDYERQFDTNVWGVLRTARATIPALARTRGRFAVVGSMMSYLSPANSSAYSMGKSAVRSLRGPSVSSWNPRAYR